MHRGRAPCAGLRMSTAQCMSTALRRLLLGGMALAALLLAGCGTLSATARNGNGQEVMLLGFDPVAYFMKGRPQRGKPDHQATTEDGRTYYFADSFNQSLFVSNPTQYEPQYGGFCAKEAAYGLKLGSDPSAWEIVDGRLFIFGAERSKVLWDMDRALNIERADAQWPAMRPLPWRLAVLKREIFRVKYYQSDAQLEREWQRRNPGKALPPADMGDALQNFVQPPGWRAAIGRGEPKLGWPQ